MPSLRQASRADLFAIFKTEAMVRLVEDLIQTVNSSDSSAVALDLAAHIADAIDAHQASAIGATPGGSRAAITVQGQLGELDAGKDAAGAATSAVSAHVALADPHTQYALDSDLSAYVPTTRTVNAKPLSANITLSASDVGALSPPAGTALLKANSGGALANATAGTDYLAPPAGTALLKANSGGALANATAGTDYLAPGGALGTPSSGTLTNCSGLPIASGVSGLAANVAAFLAAPSSANMAAMITDETGTGSNVFATNPTVTNPIVAGTAYVQQVAQTSKAAAATLTIAELLTGIIQYTGAAANLTLPTGTNIEGGVVASLPVDRAFDFIVINTGSGVATVVTNTGLTTVGTLTVATATSARFRVRKTATNTYTVYRIG